MSLRRACHGVVVTDLDVTLCLQAQGEVQQEGGPKAAQQHVMVLLHSCGYVLEQARQCGDEVSVIFRVTCTPCDDCPTAAACTCHAGTA